MRSETVDGPKTTAQFSNFVTQPATPERFGQRARNYARYMELAREAAVRGDDVEVQNCYQHAEQYFRTMKGRE